MNTQLYTCTVHVKHFRLDPTRHLMAHDTAITCIFLVVFAV
jgi:hypothetical protein